MSKRSFHVEELTALWTEASTFLPTQIQSWGLPPYFQDWPQDKSPGPWLLDTEAQSHDQSHDAGNSLSHPPPSQEAREIAAGAAHTFFHQSESTNQSHQESYPVSAIISGATYVGVPQTVYKGPSTTVASPKSPSFKDLVPSGYSHTWNRNQPTISSSFSQ